MTIDDKHPCSMQSIEVTGTITTLQEASDGLLAVGITALEGARRAVQSPGKMVEVRMTFTRGECTMYFVYKPETAALTRWPLPDLPRGGQHSKTVVFSQMVGLLPPRSVAGHVVRMSLCSFPPLKCAHVCTF